MRGLQRGVASATALVLVGVGSAFGASVPAAAQPPGFAGGSPVAIAVHASPAAVVGGHRVTLAGRVRGAAPGSLVALYVSPYPYRTTKLLGSTPTSPSGSFCLT